MTVPRSVGRLLIFAVVAWFMAPVSAAAQDDPHISNINPTVGAQGGVLTINGEDLTCTLEVLGLCLQNETPTVTVGGIPARWSAIATSS